MSLTLSLILRAGTRIEHPRFEAAFGHGGRFTDRGAFARALVGMHHAHLALEAQVHPAVSVAAGRVWRTVQRAPLFDADLRTLVDATARSNDRWVPTGRPGAQ